ncbi:uncharacterized protein LOC126833988 [Adelges cooleyi]|uniref:uncharacterized protein LOC126833988 n=1 Tax=Adelges cooleyi TaxID=133065 RepID=UPI00217F6DD4|nr:uncharacterized protein LOC126833988 [Adelges cooleyi]
MSEKPTVLLFNRNSAGEVDDSELIDDYNRQYEKVKKKAKAKLQPIDSFSELSLNDKDDKPKKGKLKKKSDLKYQNVQANDKHHHYENNETFIPPPPPPPDFLDNLPKNEREALTAMLMSYYMTGFHTGYYLGLKKNSKQD